MADRAGRSMFVRGSDEEGYYGPDGDTEVKVMSLPEYVKDALEHPEEPVLDSSFTYVFYPSSGRGLNPNSYVPEDAELADWADEDGNV